MDADAAAGSETHAERSRAGQTLGLLALGVLCLQIAERNGFAANLCPPLRVCKTRNVRKKGTHHAVQL